MKKRILIITYDMIPYSHNWGSCQRMYYLATHLHDLGDDVTVVSYKKDNFNHFGNEIVFEIVPLDLDNSAIKKDIYSDDNLKYASKRKTFPFEFLNKLVFNIKNNFGSIYRYIFNDTTGSLLGLKSQLWCIKNKQRLIQLIDENKIDTIIISGPPFGLFSLSNTIKKKYANIQLILDYRDPWNLWEWENSSLFSRSFEKKYLNKADHIVCTNKNHIDDLSYKFNISIGKFSVVCNGYSDHSWSDFNSNNKIYETDDKKIITYVGYIDFYNSGGYRDTSELFQAFDEMLKTNRDIKLRFVGIKDLHHESINTLKNRFGENIEFVGVVTNIESYKYMINSDSLLLLHTSEDSSCKYLVSGKLYDYVKAEKPILSIGSDLSIHRSIINEEKLGVHTRNDASKIYDALFDLLELIKKDQTESRVVKDKTIEYSREYQNKKYWELIHSGDMEK